MSRLKAEGQPNLEIARRVGVSEVAIRKLVSWLGWCAPRAEQAPLPLNESTANPNVSAALPPSAAPSVEMATPAANPNVSVREPADDCPTSFDTDPADRCLDRLFARLGLLDDAAPLFRDGGSRPQGRRAPRRPCA